MNDIANDRSTTAVLRIGSSFESAIESDGDIDYVRVDVVAGRSYIFGLVGTSTDSLLTLHDPYLELFGAGSTALVSDDDSGRGLDSRIVFTAEQTGSVYLAASAYSGTGSYRLTSEELGSTDDFGQTSADAGSLKINQWMSGAVDRPGDQDWFAVHLDAGGRYDLLVSGQDGARGSLVDPVLTLYDAQGRVLTTNDDSGDTLDSLIQYTATAGGTYFLGVSSAYDDAVGSYQVAARSTGGTSAFDALLYAASNPDVARAFGTDEVALQQHYRNYGQGEGRAIDSFDPLLYAASNLDVARAFGIDQAALERHYIQYGLAEGRATTGFDTLFYAASNADVARAFGADTHALERHFIQYGLAEGRPTHGFDALLYASSNPDVARLYGANENALASHYVNYGLAEGRSTSTFDPLAYAAANPDVAQAFGADRHALELHYINYGLAEGRSPGDVPLL